MSANAVAAVWLDDVRYLAISALLAFWLLAEGPAKMAGSMQGARLLFAKPLVRKLWQRHWQGQMTHTARPRGGDDLCSQASCIERV